MSLLGRTLHTFSIAVLLFAGSAHAQFLGNPIMQVNVPFEFSAGKKTFPAGHYSFVRANPSTLIVRDSSNRVVAAMVTSQAWSSTAPAGPKLVFYNYGGRHVLARIWLRSERSGYEVSRPKTPAAVAEETVTPVQTASGNQP